VPGFTKFKPWEKVGVIREIQSSKLKTQISKPQLQMSKVAGAGDLLQTGFDNSIAAATFGLCSYGFEL
jgi:hypothetical protein